MQTAFTLAQLADPGIKEADKILRACVHCGFCTATCPTYVLLGDERDSPRGRIYLIKDMLEKARPADAVTVKHVDRCLSCLACMTTCPSGVHYMHLVDHGRAYIERTYKRPFADRLLRHTLAAVLPYAGRFRAALMLARFGRIFAPLMPRRLRAMLALAPRRLPAPSSLDRPQVIPAQGARKKRVALLSGCAQRVLDPEINAATIRLLTRHGCEVVIADGAECCGALVHHMGMEARAHAQARRTIEAWLRAHEAAPLDAVVINTSGCGTNVKDYGFVFRTDPAYAAKAAKISSLTRDVTEFMAELGLEGAVAPEKLAVAYHSACSMQHGQNIDAEPKALLAAAGFAVREIPEGHLCCGSAGTYNMLQPVLARRLRDRKVENIARVAPDVVATGNIGCMVQIGGGTRIPVVHTVQLLDWATGGPRPPQLERR
jgi:glycolate oxidase iron-sulfur subunit